MQGVLRVSKKPALIKLRTTVNGLPSGARVDITDLMLQPGAAVSGWLPHTTELPWSAGVVPPEGSDQVNDRIDLLQDQIDQQQEYLNKIMAPAQVWRGDSSGNNAHISTLWDPDYGWISWIDVGSLPGTGDIGFWFPFEDSTAASTRPFAWTLDVLLQDITGLAGVRPRVDYMNGTTVTGSNAQLTLTAWPDWSYKVEHDFILPANQAARPAFLILGKTSGASGRIGLTRPKLGTRSEVSQ